MTIHGVQTDNGISTATQKASCEHLSSAFSPSDGRQSESSLALASQILPQLRPNGEIANECSPGSTKQVLQSLLFEAKGGCLERSVNFRIRLFDEGRPVLAPAVAAQRLLVRGHRKAIIQDLVHPFTILEKPNSINASFRLSPHDELFRVPATAAHRGQGTLQWQAAQRPSLKHLARSLSSRRGTPFTGRHPFRGPLPSCIRGTHSEVARGILAIRKKRRRGGWKVGVLELSSSCPALCSNGLHLPPTHRDALVQLHLATCWLLAQAHAAIALHDTSSSSCRALEPL
mmetsp:Transcript_130106/g.308672  ORF Transcript_130106/g.308672 Transcript_130106/m.308672 type:complete len:287 (+) Transcript_130106:1052-1912(+)